MKCFVAVPLHISRTPRGDDVASSRARTRFQMSTQGAQGRHAIHGHRAPESMIMPHLHDPTISCKGFPQPALFQWPPCYTCWVCLPCQHRPICWSHILQHDAVRLHASLVDQRLAKSRQTTATCARPQRCEQRPLPWQVMRSVWSYSYISLPCRCWTPFSSMAGCS